MPLQARIAAGLLALIAAVAPAAARDVCEKSLVNSDPFWNALTASGLATPGAMDEEFKPTARPPEPMEFLDLAKKAGFEGRVIVLLVVAHDGSIADRVILCAAPFGYFEPEVLDWSKGFRFAPLEAGMPERYRFYQVRVNFKFE